jgi:hypothetical protein
MKVAVAEPDKTAAIPWFLGSLCPVAGEKAPGAYEDRIMNGILMRFSCGFNVHVVQ